jgi:hypothetical protein
MKTDLLLIEIVLTSPGFLYTEFKLIMLEILNKVLNFFLSSQSVTWYNTYMEYGIFCHVL